MKTILLALTLSLPVFAGTTCFVRDAELATDQVKLAREVCVTDIALQLDVLAGGKALVSFSLDGRPVARSVDLRSGREIGDGTVAFSFSVERSTRGGQCDDSWEAESTGTLIVKRDGSSARVTGLVADIDYSSDNCHSGFRTVQRINYSRQ